MSKEINRTNIRGFRKENQCISIVVRHNPRRDKELFNCLNDFLMHNIPGGPSLFIEIFFDFKVKMDFGKNLVSFLTNEVRNVILRLV